MADLPLFGTNVDKSQVPPIHQKRIVAFVNTFIFKTATFLDQFVAQCENKFLDFEVKLRRVDAQLKLLEAKLDSIPGLETPSTIKPNTTEITTVHKEQEPSSDTVDQKSIAEEQPKEQQTENVPMEEPVANATGVKAIDDYRYKKYFKMAKFGVPNPAIKLKIHAEGLDPDILDTPDRILPDGVIEPVAVESDSESD